MAYCPSLNLGHTLSRRIVLPTFSPSLPRFQVSRCRFTFRWIFSRWNLRYFHFLLFRNQIRTFRSSAFLLSSSSSSPSSGDKKPVQPVPSIKTDPVAWAKRLSVLVWDVLVHTWNGFRLLGLNIRTACGLIIARIRGHKLSRREYRLLLTTAGDIFRMVPFSLFIIIPMAEFLLPFFLHFFPNLLPSTFETDKDRLTKQEKLQKLRENITIFLKDTSHKLKDYHNPEITDQFEIFVERIKKGQAVPTEDVFKFISKFRDDLTLDNLKPNQIQALCKFLSLSTIGPTPTLRMNLLKKIEALKKDDEMILSEGLESMSTVELKIACAERGMNSMRTRAELIPMMEEWLELSKNKVPTSLLILSRAFTTGKHSGQLGQVLVVSLHYILYHHLPDTVFDEVETEIELTENDPKARLLKIKEERLKVAQEKSENLQEQAQVQEQEKKDLGSVKEDKEDKKNDIAEEEEKSETPDRKEVMEDLQKAVKETKNVN